MILDDVSITIKAGHGGKGAVSFRREKYVPKGGPDGGNGGKGGDIYFKGVTELSALNQFRFKKEAIAEDGVAGGKKKKAGKNSPDLIIKIPIGTKVTNIDTDESFEIKTRDELVLMAKGGNGGLGNWELRSSTNTTPREAEPGEEGETKNIRLNLQFIADIGLIGLPNGGKSSLLNVLTNADAKIGDYAFTTLEPNLGDMDGIIIADIPGLIEGASQGKGLGIKFLKHIEKTHLLVHCIDVTSPSITDSYKIIRNELASFNTELTKKKELLLLTKIDLVSEEELQKKVEEAMRLNPHTFVISLLDEEKLSLFKHILLED